MICMFSTAAHSPSLCRAPNVAGAHGLGCCAARRCSKLYSGRPVSQLLILYPHQTVLVPLQSGEASVKQATPWTGRSGHKAK